jgi:hypothetical protein
MLSSLPLKSPNARFGACLKIRGETDYACTRLSRGPGTALRGGLVWPGPRKCGRVILTERIAASQQRRSGRVRSAIAEVARGFVSTFPDMQERMDDLLVQNGRIVYRWTLIGSNAGLAGGANASASADSRNGRSVPMGALLSRRDTSTLPPTNWNVA